VVGGDGERGVDDGAPGVGPTDDAASVFAGVLVGAGPGVAVRVSAGTAPAAERVVLHLQTQEHATVSLGDLTIGTCIIGGDVLIILTGARRHHQDICIKAGGSLTLCIT
jgi:hypothetical protein